MSKGSPLKLGKAGLVIVGLGNPSPVTQGGPFGIVRHSVGLAFVDYVREKHGGGPWRKISAGLATIADVPPWRVTLVRPWTAMNLSGSCVSKILKYLQTDAHSLLVVHDELEKPPGWFGIKEGGSASGHRGLMSITDSLRTEDYHRLRIGIGRPTEKADVPKYVLSPMEAHHGMDVKTKVFPAAWELIQTKYIDNRAITQGEEHQHQQAPGRSRTAPHPHKQQQGKPSPTAAEGRQHQRGKGDKGKGGGGDDSESIPAEAAGRHRNPNTGPGRKKYISQQELRKLVLWD
mmetsp:Transcript_18309/g.52212  ORF Transcript_18309/g.52212 Transcript_18309/m.52212 type:complete len:289 (-) Transcript_18309:1003-1869(-)